MQSCHSYSWFHSHCPNQSWKKHAQLHQFDILLQKSDHPWLLMIIFYSKHFFLLVFNWDTIIERLCLLILGKSNLFGGFLTLFLPSEYGKRKCKTDHSAKFQKTHPYTHTLTLHTAHNYLRNVKLKSLLAHKKVWNPPPIHPLAVAYNVCKILFL